MINSQENKIKAAQLKMVLNFFDKWEQNIVQKQSKLYEPQEKENIYDEINSWQENLQQLKKRSEKNFQVDLKNSTQNNKNQMMDILKSREYLIQQKENELQIREQTIIEQENQIKEQIVQIQQLWKYIQINMKKYKTQIQGQEEISDSSIKEEEYSALEFSSIMQSKQSSDDIRQNLLQKWKDEKSYQFQE